MLGFLLWTNVMAGRSRKVLAPLINRLDSLEVLNRGVLD